MSYYSECAFPKPGNSKKKKKCNGYKNKPERYCRYCGEGYAERHEVFGGPNRQNSIDEGFQVDVCRYHHEQLHNNSTEWAKKENQNLRSYYERKYIDKLIDAGVSEDKALDVWMSLIGKNYIEELMPS